jgi:hypothetical protein
MYSSSVQAERICHYTVATYMAAEGSAEGYHGLPLRSAVMVTPVTCSSTLWYNIKITELAGQLLMSPNQLSRSSSIHPPCSNRLANT